MACDVPRATDAVISTLLKGGDEVDRDDEKMSGGDLGLATLIMTPVIVLIACAIGGVKILPWW